MLDLWIYIDCIDGYRSLSLCNSNHVVSSVHLRHDSFNSGYEYRRTEYISMNSLSWNVLVCFRRCAILVFIWNLYFLVWIRKEIIIFARQLCLINTTRYGRTFPYRLTQIVFCIYFLSITKKRKLFCRWEILVNMTRFNSWRCILERIWWIEWSLMVHFWKWCFFNRLKQLFHSIGDHNLKRFRFIESLLSHIRLHTLPIVLRRLQSNNTRCHIYLFKLFLFLVLLCW